LDVLAGPPRLAAPESGRSGGIFLGGGVRLPIGGNGWPIAAPAMAASAITAPAQGRIGDHGPVALPVMPLLYDRTAINAGGASHCPGWV
jgi:hypothetical protein